ncbi:MAG: hypothetical protein KMY55_08140 [Dethiosulfatibacter sp.]|nr:hypothetical protein [Dethiosulfatibacter sp.]
MKRSGMRILAVLLIIIIFLSGCSPALKASEPDEPTKSSEEPSSSTPMEEINHNIEQEFVSRILGGIFYTINSSDPQNLEFSEIRKDSIHLFNDSIFHTATNAFIVTQSLEAYRNLLMESMDAISSDPNNIIFEITKGILTYKTALNSYEVQFKRLLTTTKKPENEVSKAAIDLYMLEIVSQLVNNQGDYLSWLIGSTEIIHAMLEETDPDKANEFLESAINIFSRDIADPYKQLLKEYHQTAEIYTYILSADYHVGEYYLNQIGHRLELLDSQRKESLKDIIDQYYEVLEADRRPPVIIDPSDDISMAVQSPQIKATLTTLTPTNDTSDGFDDYYTNAIAMQLLWEVQGRITDREWDWSVQNIFLEDLLLNTKLTERIRLIYENRSEAYINPEIQRRFVQSIQSEEVPEEEKSENVNRIKEQVASMENAANPRLDRQAIIDRISLGQNALDEISFLGDDIRYSLMIEMINTILTEGKSNGLDNEKIENISSLINNDLIEILRDQKGDFIRQITSLQADVLIDIFDDWKKNTENFNEFNFNRDDLIRLVAALGVDVATVPETPQPTQQTQPTTLPSETSQPTQPTTSSTEETTTNPSQPVLKGYWELVKTEEVIPSEYSTGDDKDSRKYTFEYSEGSIGCNYTRVVYDGIKKTYLTELIDTSGGWSMVIDDDAYLPEEKVKINLNATIDHFQRLTAAESGGTGTNENGVAVWAYIGNEKTPFGNATSGILESIDGASVCRATISGGKIIVPSATMEVTGTFGEGKNQEQKVLFVVVSNQGRVGGIKYTYEYFE